MVVGIIGILAAVAIPAYNNYTKKAKIGVAESMLQTMKRSRQIQKSVGETPTAVNLWASVESGDEGYFTNTYTEDSSDDTIWCIGITAKISPVNDYDDIGFSAAVAAPLRACLSNAKSKPSHNGDNPSATTVGVCTNAGVCG